MDKKYGPWRIRSKKEVYRNPWMKVAEYQIIRPDGKRGIYGTAHFKPGVSVLPIDDDGFVYLVEEFMYALGRKDVEAPGGGIDGRETPLAAAKRELKEELGITSKQWIPLGVANALTAVVDSPQYLYLARKLSFSKSRQEGTETLKPKKVRFERALGMVMSGKITEDKSCILILKANEYIKNRKRGK